MTCPCGWTERIDFVGNYEWNGSQKIIRVGDCFVRLDDDWQECIIRGLKCDEASIIFRVKAEATGAHNKHRGAVADFYFPSFLANWRPLS